MRRYGILITSALAAALIVACWDFSVLLNPVEQPDAGSGAGQLDAADCTGSALAEVNCSDGLDDNGNCLIDCKDPSCKWDRACRPDLAEPADMATPSDIGSDMSQG